MPKVNLYGHQTCMDVCGMAHPCGNTYCSCNPQYVKPEERIVRQDVAFLERMAAATLKARYIDSRLNEWTYRRRV